MQKIPILLVDDQEENRLLLESLLDNPDLHIIRAVSGQDALGKIFEYSFALIMIDVQMPGMEKYEIAELLRSSLPSRSIPLLFLTAARMGREYLFNGSDLGAVDYIFKPLEPPILKRKVSMFLELHRQRQQLGEKTRELDAKILELEVLYKELEERNANLERLSSLDCLTGLFNRRYFDDNLAKEWKQAIRTNSPLSLLIVDIDYFKNYNDCYGHLEGDDCLRKVAQALYEALMRPADIIARYGGEEFTAILPNTGSEGAASVARRMMEHVAHLAIEHQGSLVAETVTVSIGASSGFPGGKQAATSLLNCADKALYAAKRNGRNNFLMTVADA